MPCPYAEKKGMVVFCKAINQKVNPLSYPCLTDRYDKCAHYRKAEEAKAKTPAAAAPPAQPQPPPTAQPPPAQKAPPLQPTLLSGSTRGLTLQGTRPVRCLECVYYGSKTGICLLLGVEVKNPYDPPCTRT